METTQTNRTSTANAPRTRSGRVRRTAAALAAAVTVAIGGTALVGAEDAQAAGVVTHSVTALNSSYAVTPDALGVVTVQGATRQS